MHSLLILIVVLCFVGWFDGYVSDNTRTVWLDASVIRVVDGDTIDHGGDRYRLVGFDTPETYRAKCAAEKELGVEASRKLRAIIDISGEVELIVQPNLDRYGRFLAEGRVGALKIKDLMINEGLAREYSGGKRMPWCTESEMVKK